MNHRKVYLTSADKMCEVNKHPCIGHRIAMDTCDFGCVVIEDVELEFLEKLGVTFQGISCYIQCT